MKKIALLAVLAIMTAACSKTPTAKICACIEGAADSSVVIQKLNFNKLLPVDTVRTDAAGKFDCKLKLNGNAPFFYYICTGDRLAASVVLLPGDNVKVSVKADGSYTVEGSDESSLLKTANDAFAKALSEMDKVVVSMGDNRDADQLAAAGKQMSKIYVDYKKVALRHVITYPYSISSAVVLFQKFNDNLKVFSEESDVVVFKRTLDSLSTVYPNSDYVLALRDEVDARSKQIELSGKFNDAQLISFPDLSLPDVDGQVRKLSDFEGKVIILSYWSAAQTEYKMFNNELVALYDKYHDQGLEIYQVSLDIDKPSWASVVKNQKLPFVNVNDGLGIQSPSVASYNVGAVPAMFVIGKDGSIAGRDIFDNAALESMIKKLL